MDDPESIEETPLQTKYKRSNRLQYLHEILVQLLINEGQLISGRTNNFLLFNSILFAGFILLLTQRNFIPLYFELLLCFFGLGTCIFHVASTYLSLQVATFWEASIFLIEKDEDFCHSLMLENYNDLDIFSTRKWHIDSIFEPTLEYIKTTRQAEIIRQKRLNCYDLPEILIRPALKLPFARKYFDYANPFLVFLLWAVSLLGII